MRIMVLLAGNIWSKPIESWTAYPEFEFLLRYCHWREWNECGADWSNTPMCQEDTLTPRSQSLLGWIFILVLQLWKPAINSMITVKSGISTSNLEHIYFERHAFDCQSRSCIFCKIHGHCCEILVFFHHLVEAGSRSTEHTVCEEYSFHGESELAQLCILAVYIWFCNLGSELHLCSDLYVDEID